LDLYAFGSDRDNRVAKILGAAVASDRPAAGGRNPHDEVFDRRINRLLKRGFSERRAYRHSQNGSAHG
jgi:hypothetical protein